MKLSNTKHILYLLLTFVFIIHSLPSCSNDKPGKPLDVKPIRYTGSYNRDFNDMNERQLEAAREVGIPPLKDREEAKKKANKLKEITSGKYYVIDSLTHSIPYLVPEAAELLEEIGKNFNAFLQEKNAPQYKLIVTSVTRTLDDCKRLGQRNINASQNSTHCYGTTVDISWKRFEKNDRSITDLTPDQLKAALANVLRDLQKNERCYIKHERQQACFHITARKSNK